ncbi:MAG: tRNA 5-methylaminomethyl-2-thiouridine biosynthesis bifunctional protein MnmC [Flavobacteriales bacterium]|nr:tRNA 5-methylaminomethyl-2-thiouridine biosynthesis bifunctional protein MnmC [Flavobacteriales bacterium]
MVHLEFKITGDNSHTLLVKELNETYHSTKGAINEALHVFMKKGLNDYHEKTNCEKLIVFEVGFGTGLNAHLAHLFAKQHQLKIDYISIEAHPLDLSIIKQLNYSELIPSEQSAYLKLHEVEWNKAVEIDEYFTLTKLHQELKDVVLENTIDVLFFDAFAPNIQPELWTKEVFESMFKALKPEGVLVTYCAKGVVKRTIKEVGFNLETLAGPPGKREMIRAVKVISE